MLLVFSTILLFSIVSSAELADYRLRQQFHEEFCRKHASLETCRRPFTLSDYRAELRRKADESFEASRRSDWVDDEMDDSDFEYYMWRKRRRQMLRRRQEWYESSNSYYPRYHYPRYTYSYPSYGSYYPSYGGYGGYGGGYGGGLLGGLFNIGFGRSIGVSTPIGGFGYHSGFGIGIG
ncbi:unnamed protein product [Caenorhabditis bovis]|uniref:Uncharacterized protein n=1 Tax=Caenorhabditis bovis TaxID=2654633 RepID=A0A8S1FFN1_9PELO|nr:unnamed protein product [Caenorhabditis bovis]